MKKREKDYKDNNWGGLEKDPQYNTYKKNIEKATDLKSKRMELLEEIDRKGYDRADVETLSAVVFNEAANSNQKAKEAVAYAYMNRADNDLSKIPPNNVISHFKERNILDDNLIGQDGRNLDNFKDWAPDVNNSMEAAISRLNQGTRNGHLYPLASGSTDIVQGADHWVSPEGLKNGFPDWTDAGDKFIVPGVKESEFTFYQNVPHAPSTPAYGWGNR